MEHRLETGAMLLDALEARVCGAAVMRTFRRIRDTKLISHPRLYSQYIGSKLYIRISRFGTQLYPSMVAQYIGNNE